MQPVPLSACNWHLQRGHSRLKKMTTTRMNQRHHGEHALAEWRTTNQKKKKKKKEGKEGPLYPFYRPIREGKGFWVTPCRKGGARHLRAGEGWANQYTPTCQSQSDGVKKTVEKGGKGLKEKKWLARSWDGDFLSVKDYQPHLSFYWFSFDVYGSKGNRHGANPN